MRFLGFDGRSPGVIFRVVRSVLHRQRWLLWLVDRPWGYPLWRCREGWRTRDAAGFDRKVRYRMVHDRRPLLHQVADKVGVRDYVASRVGAEHLTEAYAVGSDPRHIELDTLPREFAAKAAHGSGGVVLVWAGADPRARLPTPPAHPPWHKYTVAPDAVSPADLQAVLASWLSRPHGWCRGKYEWAYQRVPRRYLIEELLTTPDRGLPPVWRHYVFDGVCAMVRGEAGQSRAFYSPQGHVLPGRFATDPPVAPTMPDGPPLPTDRWYRMLSIAQELGRGLDFVRVDLYEVEGRISFGELTLYPRSGRSGFVPGSFDQWLGGHWSLPPREQLRGTAH